MGNAVGLLPITDLGYELLQVGVAFRPLVGINLLSVDVNVERARAARFNVHFGFELPFEVLFQAPGLKSDVVSEKAALDDDFHKGVSQITGWRLNYP